MFPRLRSRYLITTISVGKCNRRMRRNIISRIPEIEVEAKKESLAHYVVVKFLGCKKG